MKVRQGSWGDPEILKGVLGVDPERIAAGSRGSSEATPPGKRPMRVFDPEGIGKSKQIQGQHSRGGFTKMVLTIGTCRSEISEAVLWQSLQAIREIEFGNGLKQL